MNIGAGPIGAGVRQKAALLQRVRPQPPGGTAAGAGLAQVVARMVGASAGPTPVGNTAINPGGPMIPSPPPSSIQTGGESFRPGPLPRPLPQGPVSEHGAGMGGAGRPTAPSPMRFAASRLAQLRAMGVDPNAALGQQPQGPDRMDSEALWRAVSPIMGAILQARTGQSPAGDMSHFSPAVQALIQSILSKSTQPPRERI